jgi:DNA-binding transcriptional LysR family regulator
MTQSAVSHAISSLENHLGVELIHRSKSGLTLTQTGEIVYKRCLLIQENYNLLYSDIIQKKNLPTRSLKIGVLPSISISILPIIIKTFNQIYPQIKIILFEGSDSEIINWIH